MRGDADTKVFRNYVVETTLSKNLSNQMKGRHQ